jgi:hypothetical protein
MFKVLIPAAAAVALVAFAARTQPLDAFPPVETPTMSWHLSHEGAMAKLAYGVENSDQLALMVTCSPGDAAAVVYGDVQPDTPRLIAASHGPAPLDPMSGGDATEARLSLQDASLTGLASRGAMRVQGDSGRFVLKAGPDERRMLDEMGGDAISRRHQRGLIHEPCSRGRSGGGPAGGRPAAFTPLGLDLDPLRERRPCRPGQ